MQFKRLSFNKMSSHLTEQKYINHVEPLYVLPGDTAFIQGPKYMKFLTEQILFLKGIQPFWQTE